MYFKYPNENWKYLTSVKKITQITYLEHAIMICLILTTLFQNKTENNMNYTSSVSNEQAVVAYCIVLIIYHIWKSKPKDNIQ